MTVDRDDIGHCIHIRAIKVSSIILSDPLLIVFFFPVLDSHILALVSQNSANERFCYSSRVFDLYESGEILCESFLRGYTR